MCTQQNISPSLFTYIQTNCLKLHSISSMYKVWWFQCNWLSSNHFISNQMSCSGLVLVSTLRSTQWLWDALHLHCCGKQDWLHQNNVISLDKYLNCWLNDPVHRKHTMCLVWLFLFCIKRTLEVATLMFDIRPYQSWSTMEKVFSIKFGTTLQEIL